MFVSIPRQRFALTSKCQQWPIISVSGFLLKRIIFILCLIYLEITIWPFCIHIIIVTSSILVFFHWCCLIIYYSISIFNWFYCSSGFFLKIQWDSCKYKIWTDVTEAAMVRSRCGQTLPHGKIPYTWYLPQRLMRTTLWNGKRSEKVSVMGKNNKSCLNVFRHRCEIINDKNEVVCQGSWFESGDRSGLFFLYTGKALAISYPKCFLWKVLENNFVIAFHCICILCNLPLKLGPGRHRCKACNKKKRSATDTRR